MPTTINTKDKRIVKLWRKGLSIQQIARKIGMPYNHQRVIDGLVRERAIDLTEFDKVKL